MADRKFAAQILADKGEVVINCNGNSMRPIMAPGESIHLRKVSVYKIGDAVFCRVNGGLQVHKISAIDEERQRYQISNNRGHVNDWVKKEAVYGLAWKIEDRVIVNEEDLARRQ